MLQLSKSRLLPSESLCVIRFKKTNYNEFAKRWYILPLLFLLSYTGYAQVPVANFTANRTSGCGPLSVSFTDQSTNGPATWNWDFGNGSLSTVQNPTIVYSQPGTYSVTLVVTNANGTHGVTKTNYITVNPSPSPTFVADLTLTCAPATVHFTDMSNPGGGSITDWFWNFGDGNTSTQQNPSHTYTTPGFYSVTLRVTSSTGCVRTVGRSNYIRVVSGITPDFLNTAPITCRAPFVINFTNESSAPGNVTFRWNFGNGGTSTLTNPSATYNAEGTYNVRLTVNSDLGCTGTVEKPVVVTGRTTTITAPDNVCMNSVVSFQNTSSATPVSSHWEFDNGVVSDKFEDTTSFSVARTYRVRLTNTFDNCVQTVTKDVVVTDKPVINFTAPVASSCRVPVTFNFQDQSPSAASWLWEFGDGQTSTIQNPSNTYSQEGDFDVTLTIKDAGGCENKLTRPGYIKIDKPEMRFTGLPRRGCAPTSYLPRATVTSVDPITSWLWDFGDGTTSTLQNPPSHNYPNVGNYTIKLYVTTAGGCTDSIVSPNAIRIGTPPIVNFSFGVTEACAGTGIAFTDLSSHVDDWEWNFGDGSPIDNSQNPTHIFADTGYFNVSLTASSNGCSRTFTHPQTIHIKPPVPEFTYRIDCNNKLHVDFTNLSIVNPVYGPVTYLWRFGDPANTTSDQVNPSFDYPAMGTYNVSLTVTNGSCSAVFPAVIKLVNELADFSVQPEACRNEQVTFSAIGSTPANIDHYRWSINGGAFAAGGRQFSRSFSAPGTYSIGLEITDVNGCTDVKVKPNIITINGPTARFTPGAGDCKDSLVAFRDNSTPAASLVKWTYDFGDGQTQEFTSAPFQHAYANAGIYKVKLTVTDTRGCTNTFESPNTVKITAPEAKFSSDFTTICPLADIQFKDESVGEGLTYRWNFGDQSTATGATPIHQYTRTNDSAYTVTLTITDIVGCETSLAVTDYIKVRSPKSAFDISDTTTICAPIETKFTFRGQDYESFKWEFDDGGESQLQNPTHFYNSIGTFHPRLVLYGFGGCTDTARNIVTVYDPRTTADIEFNPKISCNELTVDFTITAPPSTKFTFNFDDGTLDSSQSTQFQHFYGSPAYYRPSLLITDNQACQFSYRIRDSIKVLGAVPLYATSQTAFCDSGTVFFTNYTIGNDPVQTRIWRFGDNTQSADLHPVHFYTRPGTYYVEQYVMTRAGCEKSIFDTIKVYGTPNPLIIGDSIACINEPLPLQGNLVTPDTAITWQWNLGNGSNSGNQNVSPVYGAAGDYDLSLIATNLLGCKDTTFKRVFVPPTPTVAFTNEPILPIGTGATLPATYGPNIAKYTWTPATNLSCTDCPNPFANPKKTITYQVEIEDIYGCTNTGEVTVTVVCNNQNYFMPNTFSPNNDGQNDVFTPRGTGMARIGSLKIFNRWGELVFERRNFMANDRSPSGGWDGTVKGKPAPADVYVYMVEFICENAIIIPVKGNVTLIR